MRNMMKHLVVVSLFLMNAMQLVASGKDHCIVAVLTAANELAYHSRVVGLVEISEDEGSAGSSHVTSPVLKPTEEQLSRQESFDSFVLVEHCPTKVPSDCGTKISSSGASDCETRLSDSISECGTRMSKDSDDKQKGKRAELGFTTMDSRGSLDAFFDKNGNPVAFTPEGSPLKLDQSYRCYSERSFFGTPRT